MYEQRTPSCASNNQMGLERAADLILASAPQPTNIALATK
jgi:hypothetical protein